MIATSSSEDLRRRIQESLFGGATDITGVGHALEHARSRARSLLLALMDDAEQLSRIAARSCFHDNRFYKLPVLTGPNDSFELRLHVWQRVLEASEASEIDIHDHRWDFSTAILNGAYLSRTFAEDRQGLFVHRQKCWTSNGEDHYRVDAEGEGFARVLTESVYSRGDRYSAASDVRHRVLPLEPMTVTLVVQGRSKRAWCSVWTTSPAKLDRPRRALQRPTAERVRSLLGHVLETVGF
jgi:hypothetical protein